MRTYLAFRLALRTRLLHEGGSDELLLLGLGLVLAVVVVKLTKRDANSRDSSDAPDEGDEQ